MATASSRRQVTRLRVSAALPLATLAGYHILRILARGCTGLQCDWFIPISLLVPVLALVLVAIAGVLAIRLAGSRRQSAWTSVFVAGTVLGVLGPPVSLLVFRDNPDAFVAVATALLAILPVSALVYSVVPSR